MAEVKPTSAAIKKYYADLAGYADHGAEHETAVRNAFFHLLEATCPAGWKWLPETSEKTGGHTIRPDATLEDQNYLPRGYWEAKDTRANLADEVEKKKARGYSLENTIFEDTRTAILYQNKRYVQTYDLTSPGQLALLLNDFYAYSAPIIVDFEKAVASFRDDVARLAGGFQKKVDEAHRTNAAFEAAYERFFALCQNSLNPNIARAAVDEMLIQHMFTERLLRTVFNQGDFTRRNVVAAEVEKVIDALISKNFDRKEFMGQLDRFYKAIEQAAETITDWPRKREFITGVYERFFQGYAVKLADTHGIVYTPAPIVNFMCASVQEVLKAEFGKELGDEDVFVVDPCVGTGSFVARLLELVPKRKLPRFYRQQLFANEVMLLPYYVAALTIEHTYHDLTKDYQPFEGLCFVDTLGLADAPQQQLGYMTEKNADRVERQLKAPITVVLGNPPYNVGQLNENDNNKNRYYKEIEKRIAATFARDSKATNKNQLSDAYVKFFRWSIDRLEGRDGVVAFVSNNGFLDGIAFDGFRKHLDDNFSTIYHFDFKGNARTSGERRRREAGNIFDDAIRVGVGISVLVRKGKKAGKVVVNYHAVDDYAKAPEKRRYLESFADVKAVPWQVLKPDARHSWLVPAHADKFEGYLPIGSKETKRGGKQEAVFVSFSNGVKTNRDEAVYDFDTGKLKDRVKRFIEDYNAEVDRWRRSDKKSAIDDFVNYVKVKWSESLKANLARGRYAEYADDKIRPSLYRLFVKEWFFFDALLNERRYQFPAILPTAATEAENRIICVSGIGSKKPFHCINTDIIPCLDLIEKTQCFPFYVYDEDGTNRRENITDWALAAFREKYAKETVALKTVGLSPLSKWDIFHYCYGLLHHAGYRATFGANLKRDLPRIPFAPEFRPFAKAGKELADLHVNYETVNPLELDWRETPGKALSYRVEKMKWLDDAKTELRINDTLTLAGVPKEAHAYKLGNRSALDWLVDQYQVKKDKATGEITSDPNRADDPEYIVNLIGRVARVSVETVRIVNALPKKAW